MPVTAPNWSLWSSQITMPYTSDRITHELTRLPWLLNFLKKNPNDNFKTTKQDIKEIYPSIKE